MLFLLYLIVRFLTRPLVGRGDASAKDLQILVLRHQLRVLRRKTGPPKFTPLNRVLLAAASPEAKAITHPARYAGAPAYRRGGFIAWVHWVGTVRPFAFPNRSRGPAPTLCTPIPGPVPGRF